MALFFDQAHIPVKHVYAGIFIQIFQRHGVFNGGVAADIAAAAGFIFGVDTADHDHIFNIADLFITQPPVQLQLGDYPGIIAVFELAPRARVSCIPVATMTVDISRSSVEPFPFFFNETL